MEVRVARRSRRSVATLFVAAVSLLLALGPASPAQALTCASGYRDFGTRYPMFDERITETSMWVSLRSCVAPDGRRYVYAAYQNRYANGKDEVVSQFWVRNPSRGEDDWTPLGAFNVSDSPGGPAAYSRTYLWVPGDQYQVYFRIGHDNYPGLLGWVDFETSVYGSGY